MSETTAPDTSSRQRKRSPSYPALDLEKALQRVRDLHAKEKQFATALETVVRHWGYKGYTGPAGLTVAALKKYGLIDEEGSGSDRVLKVTDLAMEAISNPDPQRRRDAIQQAALTPGIHQELWDRYGNELPSDANLMWELTRNRGFTETGASEFIREYRQTLSFAQLRRPTDASDDLPDDDSVAEVASETPRAERVEKATSSAVAPIAAAAPPARSEQAIRIPLPDGRSVTIDGAFPLSDVEWTAMLGVLEAMKPVLARAAATPVSDLPPSS